MNTIKLCRMCSRDFSDDNPQSAANPNLCIPCATGVSLEPSPFEVEKKGRWTHDQLERMAQDSSRSHYVIAWGVAAFTFAGMAVIAVIVYKGCAIL